MAIWPVQVFPPPKTSEIKFQNPKNDSEQLNDIANQYLERQLVIETYTRGTGVGGALTAAIIATTACGGNPLCGAAGGLAGAVSNYIPILGQSTAEEIAKEQQKSKM